MAPHWRLAATLPAAVVAVVTAALVAPAAQADPPAATVAVDAGRVVGPANLDLVGFGWNDGSVEGLAQVAELSPHTVRIDARLERISRGPGDLDVTPLLDSIAAVRAIGAEPQVILSYLPPWLGETNAHGRDATRVAPSDLDAWEALIEAVVEAVATAPASARRFEVWNEPDIPIFWQDTPVAFVELALRTHRAVATVAARTGLDLEVGGPASFFADPVFLGAYVEAVTRAGLPLDFVSWHHYGNTPFLGPDGAEDILPPYLLPLYPVAGNRNPITTPAAYGAQVAMVRALVKGVVAGRGGYDPDLVLDEWNVSAGGYDVRHDTHEGAAFAAGTLIELERAGLDAADYYRATGSDRPGDWGLVAPDGAGGWVRKPSWWVFRAWSQTGGDRLAVSDDPATGLFARATATGAGVDVLLASFVATGGGERTITVEVDGCTVTGASVRRLDATSDDLATATPLAADPTGVVVAVAPQSVQWLTFGCD